MTYESGHPDEGEREELAPEATALQARIDGALCRAFQVPDDSWFRDVARLAACDTSCAAPAGPLRRLRPSTLLLAASILLAVSGGFLAWRVLAPSPTLDSIYAAQQHRTMERVYADARAGSWEPDWVCRDDLEFMNAFRAQLGRPLMLRGLPATVAAGGLTYSNTITPNTMVVLASAPDARIAVFVDRVDAETAPPPPPPDGFHLHRKVEGELVLYEFSPLDRPTILPYLVDPERPDAP